MSDDKSKRKAIIVGINEYQDRDEQGKGKFAKLKGAENDAKDFKERLEDPENPEFNYDINYLTGSNATCANIRKALNDVFWKTEETCDVALFYFSGHGKEVEYYGEGYIAPYDMLFDDPFVCGIKMSELRQVISKSPHKCTITILDCCYSGLATKDKGDFNLMTKVDEHINDFVEGEGRIILASSGENQKSREITWEHEVAVEHEGEGKAHPHGAFTYSLIEGIDNGKTTLGELKFYVNDKIKSLSESMKDLKNQQCRFLVSGGGDFENTVIARSHEDKCKATIQIGINAAMNHCESGSMLELIVAVHDIQNVLKIHNKNQEALDVKDKIIQDLEYCKKNVDSWIGENTPPRSGVILKVFPTLENFAHNVNFDGIVSLSGNNRDRAMLTNLCRVSAGEITQSEFEEKIRQYESPSSGQKKEIAVMEKTAKVGMSQKSSISAPSQLSPEKMDLLISSARALKFSYDLFKNI